jgi:phosphatidylserine/phosphatidylglycerophosphate/cardiolipin synthase-like enzyme
MKHLATLLLLPLISLEFVHSQTNANPDFELVESIPIETNLDNPDIPNTFEVWLEMINGAKKSLDIEQFYISNKSGEALEDILTAIISASERGVNVRIIVDSALYKTYPHTVDSLSRKKNIEARVISYRRIAGGVQHAKFFIIDGEEIFLGSQNFDWRALKHIHELGVRIRHNEALRIYQEVFDLDWKLAIRNDESIIAKYLTHKRYSMPLMMKQNNGTSIVFYPTMSPQKTALDTLLWDQPHIVELIDSAKTEVCLQFLSYNPVGRDKSFYPALDNAMRRAAARNVKVKMIVSDWAKDHPEVDHLKSLACVPNIEVKFSSIPEWSGGYISYARVEHCKFIVADGSEFWIGTSNGEKSYFYTSRNLGVIVKNKNLAEAVQKIFYKSWDGPYTELINPGKEYEPRKHGGE